MEKKFKTFIDEDGNESQFSPSGFKSAKAKYCLEHKTKKGEMDELLAEHIGVSVDSIKNYQKGANGPSDLEQVKKMAEFLECERNDLLTGLGSKKASVPAQPQINLPEATCEKDVVNNVFRRLLFLMQKSGDTEYYEKLMCKEQIEPVYTVFGGVRVRDAGAEDEAIENYYHQFLMDTKKVVDEGFIFLEPATEKKLLYIIKGLYKEFSRSVMHSPMSDHLEREYPIELFANVSKEYVFTHEVYKEYIYEEAYIGDAIFSKYDDAKFYLECFGNIEGVWSEEYARDVDMEFFYENSAGDTLSTTMGDLLSWSLTQALKKLFAKEFPQYYTDNTAKLVEPTKSKVKKTN